MPEKKLPIPAEFAAFEQELSRRRFREFTRGEFRAKYPGLRLVAPRRIEGREIGYIFEKDGLAVFVWTTWLRQDQTIRNQDAGWVLIVGKGKESKNEILFCSYPIRRTKNFLANLLMEARIARWRVAHQPKCPMCEAPMVICFGNHLKERFWICRNREAHMTSDGTFPQEEIFTRWWNTGIPEEGLAYLRKQEARRAVYERKALAAGKNPHTAMLERAKRPWRKVTA